MSDCGSCHAPLIWAVTAKGKLMPVDAEPTAAGNVVLAYGRPGERPLAVVVSGDERLRAMADAAVALHVAHFVSCPHAERYRDRQKRTHADTRR